uniref:Tail assembly chaperone n=1 Tax=Mycobacterium phage Farewell TaxID=3158893 RepID=A0AAU8GNU2_9CAUD
MAATPKKRTAKGSSVAAAAGEPIGKWAQVLAETREAGGVIEPFEITADLVLYPPTPARAKAMGAAQNAAQAAIAAMFNAAKFGATPEEVDRIQQTIEAADLKYTKALIGDDEFEAVEAYFAHRGAWERDVFLTALKKQFLRLPDEEEIDFEERTYQLEEALREVAPDHPLLAPGKGNESSTTSSTTGMSSRPTSPENSTESTPETGSGGTRPWSQFLNYATKVARIEGSETQAAMLRDERLRPRFQQMLAESDGKPSRPELAGFTREVSAIHKVNVTLTHLLRVMSKNMAIPIPQGPIYPAEQWELEKEQAELDELDADIASSMKPRDLTRGSRRTSKGGDDA